MKRKLLLTGAAGRIGSFLTNQWKEQYDLVLTDVRMPQETFGFPFVEANLADFATVSSLCTGSDTVVHCAPTHAWKRRGKVCCLTTSSAPIMPLKPLIRPVAVALSLPAVSTLSLAIRPRSGLRPTCRSTRSIFMAPPSAGAKHWALICPYAQAFSLCLRFWRYLLSAWSRSPL